jgi:hypothetical protein
MDKSHKRTGSHENAMHIHHYMLERTLTCLMFSAKKPSNNRIENVGIVVKTTVEPKVWMNQLAPMPT